MNGATLAARVRAGQGPFWGACRQIVRRVLEVHVPVVSPTKPFFAALYRGHVAIRELWRWTLRFFWFEPLFRSQCERIGPRFRMESLPYLVGNGRIRIGANVRLSGKSSIGFASRAWELPQFTVGDGTFIGHDCTFQIARSITIGRHCLVATRVRIVDSDGHPLDAMSRRHNKPAPVDAAKPVVIEDDVWIGAGAIVLKGVRIGGGSIVGAGAVVTRDVPGGSVVGGNPATEIRRRIGDSGRVTSIPEEIARRGPVLHASRWQDP